MVKKFVIVFVVNEIFNGFNMLFVLIEIVEGKFVQFGDVVCQVFDKFGLSVEEWNVFVEVDCDGFFN